MTYRVKPEILLQPAADPVQIKWTCIEECGSPIHRIPEGSIIKVEGEYRLGKGMSLQDVTVEENHVGKDGLTAGMQVLVPTMFGWSVATIEALGDGWCGKSGGMLYILDWRDDYVLGPGQKVACWTCCGSANLEGLKRLTLY